MTLVDVAMADGLAVVSLRRPQARNALNVEMKEELLYTLESVRSDRAVRAVLVRGDGPAFCVGQDLREHADALERDPRSALSTVRDHYNRIVTSIANLRVPVVVAIRGACAGAGLGFALAGDIRIAAEDATFVTAFAGIGLASDSGLARALVHTAGMGVAQELLLLDEPFDAAQARAWGLVTRVVPAADVDAVSRAIGVRLAAGPTVAFTRLKRLLRRAGTAEFGQMLEWEAETQRDLALTEDHRTAVAAFLDKRAPEFSGR